jgi:hypothetical protein
LVAGDSWSHNSRESYLIDVGSHSLGCRMRENKIFWLELLQESSIA